MEIEITSTEKRPVIGMRRRVENSEIGDFIREAFQTVGPYFNSEGMEMTGPPVAIFYGPVDGKSDVAAGSPVTEVTSTTDEIIELELAAGKVATTVYIGPYDGVVSAWEAMMKELESRGVETVEPCWEEYITDPSNEPDSTKWQTLLVQPVV